MRTPKVRKDLQRNDCLCALFMVSPVFRLFTFEFFTLISLHPLNQVVSDPERVRHDGESRVHRPAGAEKTAIDKIEIVHIMRFAVHVEGTCPEVLSETNRAYLVCDTRQWNALAYIQVPRKQSLVAFMAMNLARALLPH